MMLSRARTAVEEVSVARLGTAVTDTVLRIALTVAVAVLAIGCAPDATFTGDRDAEIDALQKHIDELVPDSWEQVGEPLINGVGCALRDCVRYSATFAPSAGPVTCDDLEALLDQQTAENGSVEADDPARPGCGHVALYDGTVTILGFHEEGAEVVVSVNFFLR